ncbi:MAG TPA: AAA family ATPase [bacterium]
MYIDSLILQNFRTFRKSEITFVHPDQTFSGNGMRKPSLANINLLLADNGLGKTTLLKAVALAALGPAVSDSGIYPYKLIRREPVVAANDQPDQAVIEAVFIPHEQDAT